MVDAAKEEWKKIAQDIENEKEIEALLQKGSKRSTDRQDVLAILEKAEKAAGLDLEEAAALISVEDSELRKTIQEAAGKVKQAIYGNRVVMFAPLYVANHCVNHCRYCGYSIKNKEMMRKKLTMDEIKEETRALINMGHKRVALEAGEDPVNIPLSYILDAIEAIYSVEERGLNLRRINVNIAATDVAGYKALHDAEIGTYILFQESYRRKTYESMHVAGPKSNFNYHTSAHHRAMRGGIEDVGFGVLYGLDDWRYETVAMLRHAHILERDQGVGPHTLSVPRVKKAVGVDNELFPYALTDEDFLQVVAVLRLALPYAGIILSTRESAELRNKALTLGISQMSAASCTGVGGYSVYKEDKEKTSQFSITDERSLAEVVRSLAQGGYMPSFCTACYRCGRTGDRFMELAKSGMIQQVCQPNALVTLKEFSLDFCPETNDPAYYQSELGKIANEKVRKDTADKLRRLEQGERDLYL